MTCIVAVKSGGVVAMAADRRYTNESGDYLSTAESKLTEYDRVIVGVAGDPRIADLVRHVMQWPTPIEHPIAATDPAGFLIREWVPALRACLRENGACAVKDGLDHGAYLLIVCSGEIFEIQGDFSVMCPQRPFHAIGSGAKYALGAIGARIAMGDAGEIASRAVKSASMFDSNTSPEVDMLEVPCS